MRVTRKMMNENSVYNINANKEYMDKVNTQMATQKKYVDPSDDPITAVRALRFRSNLSEVTQYLGRNVSDAVSWTETTQTSIDSAREIMRSLKAEYTSAANGTNESKDQRIYYANMKNLVDEYFSLGNASSEDRHLFTGYRTLDSLTLTDADFEERKNAVGGGRFQYVAITETFGIDDIESYSYTARYDPADPTKRGTGLTNEEITNYTTTSLDETEINNISVFRIRLSYEDLDTDQSVYKQDDNGNIIKPGGSYRLEFSDGSFINITDIIENDTDKIKSDFSGNEVYLNYKTGNLIFGAEVQKTISAALSAGETLSFAYNKTGENTWKEGDAKPEYYFSCFDIGLGTTKGQALVYNDYNQAMNYHMGDSQDIKVNANACDVFTLDARRDLDEIYDYMNLRDSAQSKVDRLMDLQLTCPDDQKDKVKDLLAAAQKELEYADQRVNDAFSNGITRAGKYFDFVNTAATEMGTTVKRLELIKTRLTEDKTTVQTQTSNNENIDLSVLTVDLSEATLSYSAALQVTGKISQQTLVNYI